MDCISHNMAASDHNDRKVIVIVVPQPQIKIMFPYIRPFVFINGKYLAPMVLKRERYSRKVELVMPSK